MFTKKIWMYWENRPNCKRPPYLDLAFETIKHYSGNYDVVLLNEESVKNFIRIPGVVSRFSEIAHKADYIRFNLLYKYGGVWLDSDIILLRNIEEAIEPYIENYDYIGYGETYGKPLVGFMACQKGCKLLEKQIKSVDTVLHKKQKQQPLPGRIELRWTEIGAEILWNIADNYEYYHHENCMLAPTHWQDWEIFNREDIDIDKYLSHNPFAVMLYNQMMFESFENVSIEEIIDGNTLLSNLFKKALNQE
jgi:mannosyltransferase OCH1-like enzyme